jgi:glycosyltransferase involved in cell wall biosynthesis
MQINQVVISAAPGDAVTNSALAYRDVLREIGPSEVFAQHVDPTLQGEVHQLSTFHRFDRGARRPADDMIIFHGSIGAPEVFSFLMGRPERIVLVYHNVSPAPAYHAYDPAFAGLLETGRRDIARLATNVTLALAPSAYNAFELVAMGYRDVRVSPLIVDVHRMREIEPDPITKKWLDKAEGPMLLYVGQLLPHKCPELLVKSFHVLSTYLEPDAHLTMVGASRSPAYRRRFDTFAKDLNLPNLHLVGPVDDNELAAHFERADAFVTASSHEGFCVPLLEAMAFDLPIVARACAAIPETLDGAGLLVPPDGGPLLFAEAMNEVLQKPVLRAQLVECGRERLLAFRPEDARANFVRHLLSVA